MAIPMDFLIFKNHNLALFFENMCKFLKKKSDFPPDFYGNAFVEYNLSPIFSHFS